MAEETVKRVTGASSLFPAIPDMSTISMPSFSGSPSAATPDAAVPIQDDPNHFFQVAPHDQRINTCIAEIASSAPVEDAVHDTVAGGKMARTASMQRVASLEHLQKRICGGPGGPTASMPWSSAVWDPKDPEHQKQNQEGQTWLSPPKYRMSDGGKIIRLLALLEEKITTSCEREGEPLVGLIGPTLLSFRYKCTT